jgi:hypothetical protein
MSDKTNNIIQKEFQNTKKLLERFNARQQEKYTRDEALKSLSADLNKTPEEVLKILEMKQVHIKDKLSWFDLSDLKDEIENPAIIDSFLEHFIMNKTGEINSLGIDYGKVNKNWFPLTEIFHGSDNGKGYTSKIIQINGINWSKQLSKDDKFYSVFGDFPMGMKSVSYQLDNNDIKLPAGRVELIKSLTYLDEDGIGFFIVEPLTFSGVSGSKFIQILNYEGYYINAILETPEDFLDNTSLIPNLIVISKNNTKNLLVAKLINHQQCFDLYKKITNILENIKQEVKSSEPNNLYSGALININDFHSIKRLDAQLQIEKLESSYKQYKQYSLEELSIEIIACKTGGRFLEKENSIYIPKNGISSVINTLSEATIKHQKYFQVVLSDIALNQYICSFFKSEIGKLTLKSLTTGSVTPHINKSDIVNLVVALPDLDTQKQVVETKNKITDLQVAINEFDKEVALNPDSSLEMINKLDDMLDAVGKLNDVDKVRAMIRGFETNAVEFKKTWRLPTRGEEGDAFNKASDRITATVFKVINSFINAKGGSLLIGVDDDTHEITGIECELNHFFKDKEIKKKIDRFDNNFEGKLKNAFLQDFIDLISYRPVLIDDNYVWLVTCKPGLTPCLIQNKKTVNHLNGNNFFVREGANSVPKNGQAQINYIMGPRFSNT